MKYFLNFNFLAKSSQECGQLYQNITENCPVEMFGPDFKCPHSVSQACSGSLKEMEGWYCTCRSETGKSFAYLLFHIFFNFLFIYISKFLEKN